MTKTYTIVLAEVSRTFTKAETIIHVVKALYGEEEANNVSNWTKENITDSTYKGDGFYIHYC